MEPTLPIQTVAILAAIPVAAFALWADYFGRSIEEKKQQPQEDKSKEVDLLGEGFRARSVGFLVLIAELSLFLGTSETREAHPVAGNLVFILAVLVQAVIQAGIDRKIGTPATHPRQYFGAAAKAILWGTGGALGYVMILLISVKAAVWAAAYFQTGTAVTALLVIIGAVFGLVAGLTANFALGPVYLSRAFLPVVAPTDAFRTHVASRFQNAGIRVPSIHVIMGPAEGRKIQGGTAFIAGFQWGRGPIKPALFVSETLINSLSESEWDAVLHHEIAHLKLSHLPRRLGLATFLISATFLVGIFLTVLLPAMVPGFRENPINGLFPPLLALGSFVAAFRLIGAQSRIQEYRADAYAVEMLGSPAAELCSALRKIDKLNGIASDSEGTNHPATERRIQALSAFATTKQESERKAA